ncbi:MAG: phosphoribosylformylglycinamidine synthase [Cytophagales bacterium]|nr:phosphoribosylformylglycinamidine synthase [Cytophagales bacterium]
MAEKHVRINWLGSMNYLFLSQATKNKTPELFQIRTHRELGNSELNLLSAVLGARPCSRSRVLENKWIGPRRGMSSPWSTHVREIFQGISSLSGVVHVEKFLGMDPVGVQDSLLEDVYEGEEIFEIDELVSPSSVLWVEDISEYVLSEGLSLSEREISYLEGLSRRLGRPLTDTELFGFGQVQSEHCRHHIFRAAFTLNGKSCSQTPFDLIKRSTQENPEEIVSAYVDNVAMIRGDRLRVFGSRSEGASYFYDFWNREGIYTLKAETHNFPTTVEPFYGAGTGTGGEIRDRLAGGRGTLPLAGTAVYMTSFTRMGKRTWEKNIPPRAWLYQSPSDILIRASHGVSDYANKFGQPLIAGSLFTFEKIFQGQLYAYDKVVMLAGGLGEGVSDYVNKLPPRAGDRVIVLGGANYRVGLGGSSISSKETGKQLRDLEQKAVQRANPEMQNRIARLIRAWLHHGENHGKNLIRSIHDHGAGGHLNCLLELLESSGAKIYTSLFPLGDESLSDKEILLNESQERMGLVIAKEDIDLAFKMAARENVPMYVVGEVGKDKRICFFPSREEEAMPLDLEVKDMFPSFSPKKISQKFSSPVLDPIKIDDTQIVQDLPHILSTETVGSKDWLTNKIDRCVGGRVAKQPTCGPLQLPLNNLGVVASEFGSSPKGLGIGIGQAPASGLLCPEAGACLALAEALGNLVWAPMEKGIRSISLSANWIWPNQENDYALLYRAVQALSDFAIRLGIPIPTGKDSLSMVQRYPDGKLIPAPGTLIITGLAKISSVRQVVEPVLQEDMETEIWYLPLSKNYELGGSQWSVIREQEGIPPSLLPPEYIVRAFHFLQQLIQEDKIRAGHDVSSGGLLSTLLEMCYPQPNTIGMAIKWYDFLPFDSLSKILFSEAPGWIVQVPTNIRFRAIAKKANVHAYHIGRPTPNPVLFFKYKNKNYQWHVDNCRKQWMSPSHLMDAQQTHPLQAQKRQIHLGTQVLSPKFPPSFTGKKSTFLKKQYKAAIIREKGSNGEEETALALYMAGFRVKDVHMTDILSGREDLSDISVVAFVGGFSHADALGAAKGWAAIFRHNQQAQQVLKSFYAREDTLSIGICNGCQLMMELSLISPDPSPMQENLSQKFECGFVDVCILESPSIMFRPLINTRLSVWIAHREGRFTPSHSSSPTVMKYAYPDYPGNPNGSIDEMAGISSSDGRHVALMPHIERSLFPWNWANYPSERKDEISPWILPFEEAQKWLH